MCCILKSGTKVLLLLTLCFSAYGPQAQELESFQVQSGDRFEFVEDALVGESKTINEEADSQRPSEGKNPFLWRPNGSNPGIQEPFCQMDRLSHIVRSTASDLNQGVRDLQSWADRCEPQLVDPRAPTWTALVRSMMLDHSFSGHPDIRPIRIHLSRGRVIRGYLGLKAGDRPRPLVIARCGLFCDADDSGSTRTFMMKLFEESPFHVLTLSNVSGSDFIKDNEVVALGGVEEGRQFIEIADLVRAPESPFNLKISSLHIIGVSLGGHGILYASLFDSLNRDGLKPQGRFSSAQAICPVVHLENAMKTIYAPGLLGTLIKILSVFQIREVIRYIPILGEILGVDRDLSRGRILEAFSVTALDYYKKMTQAESWPLKPFEGMRIQNLDELWSIQNFVTWAGQIEVPTLVIPSKDDHVVKYRLNSQLLENEITDSGKLKVVTFENGDHCALSATAGWSTETHIWREFILAHSPEFPPAQHKNLYIAEDLKNLSWPRSYKMFRGNIHAQQNFTLSSDAKTLYLQFKILDTWKQTAEGIYCGQEQIWRVPSEECYRWTKLPIQLARLGFNLEDHNTLESRNRLERYLNTNLKVVDDQGRMLNGGQAFPSYILWDEYQ